MTKNKNMLGIMSGSSLDGVDFALVKIYENMGYHYEVIKATTVEYPEEIICVLLEMESMTIYKYLEADRKYTKFLCEKIKEFIGEEQVDLISSHGHTIFHQPQNGFTLQCGDPVMIAALTKIDVVANFRLLDVYRGGQGAPLVPYGSQIMNISDTVVDIYLNLGGICNIDNKQKGWDIGFCNMYSNMVAAEVNMRFDEDGKLGQTGIVNKDYLQILRKDRQITKNIKSFGRQHFNQFVKRISSHQLTLSPNDKLRTYYQYLSQTIESNLKQLAILAGINKQKINVVCTGGGSYNKFLIHLLNRVQGFNFIVPSKEIVEFKEAIIFAFLGYKNLYNIQNCQNGVGGVFVRGASYQSVQKIQK